MIQLFSSKLMTTSLRCGLLLSLLLMSGILPGCSKEQEDDYNIRPLDPTKDEIRIAIYRGPAGCEDCSETVEEAIKKMPVKSKIDFIGPDEDIDITKNSLKNYDVYIQPGGGQNIEAAYNSLGEKRVNAIKSYVASGGKYLGLCMGAYLADASWLGLIPEELDGEIGRPGFPITTIDEGAVPVSWLGSNQFVFFQDGPYMHVNKNDPKSFLIASYKNGDVAAARYSFGNGLVILTGPHPEAGKEWFDEAGIPQQQRPTKDLFADLFYSFYKKK